MTKEEFNDIIKPLFMLGETDRKFMIIALNGNFDKYVESKVKNLGLFDVMPRFLDELAEKHSVDVTKIMVGKVGNDLYVWRYNEGSYERFKTLEIITLNGA